MSKLELLHNFMHRVIYEGIAESAISSPDTAKWLNENRSAMTRRIIDQIDVYRMKELQDICDWKIARIRRQ